MVQIIIIYLFIVNNDIDNGYIYFRLTKQRLIPAVL